MIRPDPSLPLEHQSEWVLLRMLIYGEARGESAKGMLAVGCNPFNRRGAGRWRRMTLAQVILQRSQYSCFNSNDPNRATLIQAPFQEPLSWARADAIATVLEFVASGPAGVSVIDPSFGATHYVVTPMWNTDAPGQWYGKDEIAGGRTVRTAVVDRHTFAKAA